MMMLGIAGAVPTEEADGEEQAMRKVRRKKKAEKRKEGSLRMLKQFLMLRGNLMRSVI
jgi:hypothetical protein